MKNTCQHLFRSLLLAIWLGSSIGSSADEITPQGQKLAAALDTMHVEQLWLAGQQVNWRTGEATGKVFTNRTSHTHCSAFAAAAAEKLGVYLLRPPAHSTVLLANAQQDWLVSGGTNQGWQPVASPWQAQQLANRGLLVVVTCKNPVPTAPGHIAIVRPSTKSEAQVLAEGPQIIQAGRNNYASTSTQEGFKHHPGAFQAGQLRYFAHPLQLSASPDSPVPDAPKAAASSNSERRSE